MFKLLCAASVKDIDQFVKIVGVEIWNLANCMLMDRKRATCSDRYHSLANDCGEIRELEKLDDPHTRCIKKTQQTFAVHKIPANHVKQKRFRLIGSLLLLLLSI